MKRASLGLLLALVGCQAASPPNLSQTQGVNGIKEQDNLKRRFQVIPIEGARPQTYRSQATQEIIPWGIRQIQADKAWKYARGRRIRVAVLDTGIDPKNPDLAPNLDLSAASSVITSGPDGKAGIVDLLGHGSHVAGIIAAAKNGLGVVGVAPEATLIPIKVATYDGGGTVGDVIEGIYRAIRARADIINLSLEFPFDPKKPEDQELARALKAALRTANQYGVLVVCAAGNGGKNLDETPVTPVSLGFNLGVSATGPINQQNFDQIAFYSNYGKAVDLAAPGGNLLFKDGAPVIADPQDLVYSTWSTQALESNFNGIKLGPATHMAMLGTSMAAPHVSGVAALALSRFKYLPAPLLKERLLGTADDLGTPSKDPFYGRGRVNALRAVKYP